METGSVTADATVEYAPPLLGVYVVAEIVPPVLEVAFNGEQPTKSGADAFTAAHCC